mgnify:CR=1 FL=1
MSYQTIAADPPWPERGGGKSVRGAQRHYDLIKTKEGVRDAMLGSPSWEPADSAHLYLWVTNNYLPWAMWLIPELGFTYKTTISWMKLCKWTADPWSTANVRKLKPVLGDIMRHDIPGALRRTVRSGIGQYFRGSHELCLFAVRGKGYDCRTERRDLSSVIVAPVGRHSAKPDAFYDLAEARSTGPRLEMFARTPRPGWDAWGNDAAVAS